MRLLLRWLILLFPTAWMLVISLASPGESRFWLWGGAGLCLLVSFVFIFFGRAVPPARLSSIVIPLMGFLWLTVTKPEVPPLFKALTDVFFLALPVFGLISFWLSRSGAFMYRRARMLTSRLSLKTDWPVDLGSCKELPEVREFREAIQFDAGPALDLLEHAHPAVRVSALAALESRQHWRIGQVQRILRLYEGERVPEVRIAALGALASVRDRQTTEMIAAAMSDADERVRYISSQVLFSKKDRRNRDRRWPWMRNGVRTALASNYLIDAGPLLKEGQLLSSDAVPDFVGWVADRGNLGVAAAETLAVHYGRLLRDEPEETSRELIGLVEDPKTPAILRIQLARLLSSQYKGDLNLMEKLLSVGNPVPLRQMAAETLLARTGRHPDALRTLREIAKLGNREIALDTARIVQQCLNIDLGLAVGQPNPHPASPRAADITRKLLQWAMQSEPSQNAIDIGGSRSQY